VPERSDQGHYSGITELGYVALAIDLLGGKVATVRRDAKWQVGRVNHPTGEMRHLKGPVMGHFATHDTWINRDMVTLFELGMLKTQKRPISHWYEAGHAFASPTDIRYDNKHATLAWQQT
jgi:dienelactone hydrolase